jgi:hypothetical protein
MINIYVVNVSAGILAPIFNDSLLDYKVLFLTTFRRDGCPRFPVNFSSNFTQRTFNYLEDSARTSL